MKQKKNSQAQVKKLPELYQESFDTLNEAQKEIAIKKSEFSKSDCDTEITFDDGKKYKIKCGHDFNVMIKEQTLGRIIFNVVKNHQDNKWFWHHIKIAHLLRHADVLDKTIDYTLDNMKKIDLPTFNKVIDVFNKEYYEKDGLHVDDFSLICLLGEMKKLPGDMQEFWDKVSNVEIEEIEVF